MARTKFVFPAFVFIILGLVLSIYLARHHYHLTYALQESKSICNISKNMDCDTVNTSRYSEIGGIPVALFSTFVLLVQLLLLLGFRVLGEDERMPPLRFFFYLSAFMVAASLAMAFISATILKSFCLLCSAHYILTFLIFMCAYATVPQPRLGLLGRDLKSLFVAGGSRGILFLLLMIPLGSWIAHGMYMSGLGANISDIVRESVSQWETNKAYDFQVSQAPRLGNPEAPIKMVEFFDFQCGHCRRAAHSLHAFVKANKDKVEIAYQNYPLDGRCNPSVPSQGNGRSCELAKASICAHEQNKFIDAYFWIFDHQGAFDDQTLSKMKTELQLDGTRFDECLGSNATTVELTKQSERGAMADIRGTPAIFMQGKLLPLGFLIPVMESALQKTK